MVSASFFSLRLSNNPPIKQTIRTFVITSAEYIGERMLKKWGGE